MISCGIICLKTLISHCKGSLSRKFAFVLSNDTLARTSFVAGLPNAICTRLNYMNLLLWFLLSFLLILFWMFILKKRRNGLRLVQVVRAMELTLQHKTRTSFDGTHLKEKRDNLSKQRWSYFFVYFRGSSWRLTRKKT